MDHALRRARLAERLAALEVDALVVTRLPNVRYLTGFTGSNGQLIVGRSTSVFLTDGRYDEQSSHEVGEVERRIYLDERSGHLARAMADLGARRVGFEREGLTYGEWERLGVVALEAELVPTASAVEDLRLVKDAEEIALVARAQDAADAAFRDVVLGGGVHEGMTERALARALELAMLDAGADDTGFDTIVAFGEDAAEPHHEPAERSLRRGDVLKVDFGASAGGYHSDMTRTVSLGEPPERLREIREVVAAAQRAGIDAVRPGVPLRSVDRAARAVVEEAGLGDRFPHGLGHGVGLEIHEVPFLRPDSPEGDVLPEGAIVTIEPGVYIPGTGGVRIEDMVEVTSDGGRVLAASPRELLVL
ncbi:MAG TPA: Xaa-Pro peptidase family protein [Actinomycetota bacterium]|nr:Xaa-Pro peptidase family protein [Actinomycetota bacterium]